MLGLLSDNINNGLLFIYGLIAIVIVLIIVIVIIDRCDSKKRKNKKSLVDTLSMKPIREEDFENKDIEILSIMANKKEKPIDLAEVSKVESKPKDEYMFIHKDLYVEPDVQPKEELAEMPAYIEEEVLTEPEVKLEPMTEEVIAEEELYVEDELEKTQAQIRVEEITKALEEAGVDEKIEHDKYAKFEEEQEKNAFISYEELKNNYDRLYEENEKTQYIEDNTIPINIKELYEAAKQEKVETLDIEEDNDYQPNNNYIEVKHTDTELNNANSFLNNLKELRDNLD